MMGVVGSLWLFVVVALTNGHICHKGKTVGGERLISDDDLIPAPRVINGE